MEIAKNPTSKRVKLSNFPDMRSPVAQFAEDLPVRLKLHVQRKSYDLRVLLGFRTQNLVAMALTGWLVRGNRGLIRHGNFD